MSIKEQIKEKRKELDSLYEQERQENCAKYIALVGKYIQVNETSVAMVESFDTVVGSELKFNGILITNDEDFHMIDTDTFFFTDKVTTTITKEEFIKFAEETLARAKEKLSNF